MGKAEKIPEGYRVTEAGILPVDWQVKRLNEVATELTERAGQGVYETVSISAGIGFVNQAEKFGKELSGKQYEKYIVLHKGDFSYNKGNSKIFPQGCIYRLNDREAAAVPNVFESFRIKEQDADYYEQLFLSGFLNKQPYSKINHGVRDDGLLNLTGKDFYSCMVPVPPIGEQKKIAEILAQYDKVIDLKRKRIDSEKKYRQALLDELLYRPFRNRKWELAFVEEVASVFGRIGFRGYTKADIVSAGQGALSLSPSNIEDNVLKTTTGTYVTWEKYYESPEIMIQADDILFVKTGSTYGKCARVNKISCASTINPQLVIVRPQHINSIFLEKIFRSKIVQHRVEQIVVGGAVPTLTQEEIRKFVIPVPTLAEQVHISNVLDALDRTIELLEKERTLWIIKKRALMQLLLTGTVRVKI